MIRAWGLGSLRETQGAQERSLFLDRGLRFGMSVFETVGVWQGTLLFESEHKKRLLTAAKQLLGADASGIWDEALAASTEFRSDKTGVLRVAATAGAGGLCEPVSQPGGWAIFEEMPLGLEGVGGAPANKMVNKDNQPALRLAISRAVYSPQPGGWKTGNYWPNIRALSEARKEGCDEAIVVNAAGQVVGAACANLFLIMGGSLVTPARETGARDGVVRAWVMAHHSCEEAIFGVEALAEAEGGFLTNSRFGVAPIGELDGRPLPASGLGQFLTSKYADEFLPG